MKGVLLRLDGVNGGAPFIPHELTISDSIDGARLQAALIDAYVRKGMSDEARLLAWKSIREELWAFYFARRLWRSFPESISREKARQLVDERAVFEKFAALSIAEMLALRAEPTSPRAEPSADEAREEADALQRAVAKRGAELGIGPGGLLEATPSLLVALSTDESKPRAATEDEKARHKLLMALPGGAASG
ncbi:MAG: hypothetical protein ACYDCK_01500 [Thermoplasmatota archaeon]